MRLFYLSVRLILLFRILIAGQFSLFYCCNIFD